MKIFYVLLILSLIVAAFADSPEKPKGKPGPHQRGKGGPRVRGRSKPKPKVPEKVTACRVQRKMAQKGEFKPTCDANGDYAALQTRDGWYWCANKEGEMLMKSQLEKPDCSKPITTTAPPS